MSLTTDDLSEIRSIVESAFARQTDEVIKPLEDELLALRNDIKEIYDMLLGLENNTTPEKQFNTLSIEEKLLRLNAELLSAARQAGINLPR